mmetsp:Transcript_23123/g.30203  ORF Transcript_23123/g.30203 Transcript_23123/m.30203 type:complete len:124 (+) Transcript_23123:128-499(+)
MAKGLRSKIKKRFRAERRKTFGEAAETEFLNRAQNNLKKSIKAQEGNSMFALKAVLNPGGSTLGLPQEVATDALNAQKAASDATPTAMVVETQKNKGVHKARTTAKKKSQTQKKRRKKKLVKF